MSDEDPRRHAPATLRNREPILEVLRRVLPPRGLVVEVASGSGEHTLHFAEALPGLEFQPTDADPSALSSIDAWRAREARANVRPALALDATADPWPIERAQALFCANMIHIAPWEAALGLLRVAGAILTAGAPFVLYGPFLRTGIATAASNLEFDESLRSRDPRWGIRRLDDVVAAAHERGLELEEIVEMPANNLALVLRRAAGA